MIFGCGTALDDLLDGKERSHEEEMYLVLQEGIVASVDNSLEQSLLKPSAYPLLCTRDEFKIGRFAILCKTCVRIQISRKDLQPHLCNKQYISIVM